MAREDSTVAEITDFLGQVVATADRGWKINPRPVMFVDSKHRYRVCFAPKIKELYTKEALDDFAKGDSVSITGHKYRSRGSIFLLICPDKSTKEKRHWYDYDSHAMVAVYLNHVLYMYDPDWTPWNPPPPTVYRRGAVPDTYTRRVTRSMQPSTEEAPLPQRYSYFHVGPSKRRSVYVYPGGHLLSKLREELSGKHHRPQIKVLAGGGENVGKHDSLGHSLHFIDMLTQASPEEADFSCCQEELGS